MKWMKHMTASWDDEKMAELVGAGGMEGLAMYGLYWRIQEILAAQMEGKDPLCSVRYSVTRWSLLLSLRGSLVFSTLSRLAATGLVTVERDGGDIRVTNRNLLKYRDEYARKSGHAPDNIPARTELNGDTELDTKKDLKPSAPLDATPRTSDTKDVSLSDKDRSLDKAKAKEERHAEFRKVLGDYWMARNSEEMPWDGSDGKNLARMLAANPTLTVERFRKLLHNRFKSEVNHHERPRAWLSRLTDFESGPLDRFKMPLDTGKKTNAAAVGMNKNASDWDDAKQAALWRKKMDAGEDVKPAYREFVLNYEKQHGKVTGA